MEYQWYNSFSHNLTAQKMGIVSNLHMKGTEDTMITILNIPYKTQSKRTTHPQPNERSSLTSGSGF
jgi:hypothetical protein